MFSFLNALTNHNIGEVEKVRFIDSFMERTTNPRIVPSRGVSSVGRASALQAEGPEFKSPTLHKYRGMEQLVARLAHNQEVIGSNPILRNL